MSKQGAFTVKELNEWYMSLENNGSPEQNLYYAEKEGIPEKFLPFEWAVDEGLDPDDRGAYYIICEFGGRTFATYGNYDSWQGTDWYGLEYWVEVKPMERIEKYWGKA